MLYIETGSTKPYVNLAHEEYFLKKADCKEPILMLWRNEPTVVVGRYQNTVNEVNQDYVEENGIHVIRRMTGGGAVYHDLGTLCYSFIIRDLAVEEASFSSFAVPVLHALEKLGIKGVLSGRNDLTIDGAKFSGTAMSLHKHSLLFHGTILYDTDLSVLSSALRVKSDKFRSKGIPSVRSRVVNIKPYLDDALGIDAFKDALKDSLRENMAYDEYRLSGKDTERIMKLSTGKYKTWDWNYGRNPAAEFHNRKKFSGGELEVYLDLKESKIAKCRIYGDFLGLSDIAMVEQLLTGVRYERNAIRESLEKIDLATYFGSINAEDIAACILGI